MSKYLTALNQIEEERTAQSTPLISDPRREKLSFDRLQKFIFPALFILGLLTVVYFFAKHQPSGPASFFTIQLVTYQTEPRAKEQALKLATEGYDAFVVTHEEYFQVCLGKFANQNLAEKERTKLKDTLVDYKGMYVRFISRS